MIDVFEALSWLNQFDASHLTQAAGVLVAMSRDVSEPDAQLRSTIRSLGALAKGSRDPLEVAEITLHRAALEYWRNAFPRAIRLATRAVRGFRDDHHRQAVAKWILGMAQWNIMENDEAYCNWAECRDFFKASLSDPRNSPSIRSCYEEPLLKMEIELAFKPEEIIHWLNEFEPPHLTPPSQQLVDTIHARIRQRAYPNAYAMMQDLQDVNRWTRYLYERAEVYFECAFFSYQMGNCAAAIELLRHAVVDFFPGAGTNHKHVVARCMLGAIEWMDESTSKHANADWRQCLAQMDELRLQADTENSQSRKKWYADHRTIILRALLDRLPSPAPARRNNRPTASAAPQPNSPSPSGSDAPTTALSPSATATHETQRIVTNIAPPQSNQPDLYSELLSMVAHDEQVAERLIEFERRSAPGAGRRELIARAIERLIDDRN